MILLRFLPKDSDLTNPSMMRREVRHHRAIFIVWLKAIREKEEGGEREKERERR